MPFPPRTFSTAIFLSPFAVAFLAASALAAPPATIGELEFLDAVKLPTELVVDGTLVGGLSGLTYDAANDRFWAVSDDRSERAPARLYRLRLDLRDGHLSATDVVVEAALTLFDRDGKPFAPRSLDPEAVAIAGDGFFVSSEGEAKAGIAPFVARFDTAGRWRAATPLPVRYLPSGDGLRGVRNNLGFESLGLSADGQTLVFAAEGPLAGDGPVADVGVAAFARIRRVDLGAPSTRADAEEFFYPLDAVAHPPVPDTGFRVNGISELVVLDRDHLLVLEREFSAGAGHRVRLFFVDLSGATDVASRDGAPDAAVRTATKRLVVDFASLGVTLTNYEAVAFGPRLPDGRISLVVVSDDNFREYADDAWMLLFAVDEHAPSIAEIQGAAHRSPREGRRVLGVEALVTAVDPKAKPPQAWLESPHPDGDGATSEGLLAACAETAGLERGRRVWLDGRLEERAANAAALPVTVLSCDGVRVGAVETLPPAPSLFEERRIPSSVSADTLTRFAPTTDALAFWESLESMRVRVGPTSVLGATKSYGELTVAPPSLAVARSGAGSTRLDPDVPSLERVLVGGRLAGGAPELPVGSTLEPFEGVVDYGFGNYRVLSTTRLVGHAAQARCEERTALTSDRTHLTVATFNVENLAATSAAERFVALGEDIVAGLGSPVLIALEEVQDDDGPGPLGGPVSSRATLERLIEAIVAAGGPRYVATWIDPEADREGGQPGGNIRVALLSDPRRIELVLRGKAGALDAAEVEGRGRATRLTLSPGRVAPSSEAFVLQQTEGVRRSLAVELRWRGRPLFVVVNHWSSKFADDRLFGARQPPRRATSEYRLRQARAVRGFADRLLASDPRAAVVILGDFNDVETSPALRELARPPWVALAERIAPADRYSFEFEGNAQLIDHVVVSPALAEGAEIDAVHRNADCPDAARSSDHDPLVARLRRAR